MRGIVIYFYVDADCWHCRSYVFLFTAVVCVLVGYKQIQTNKQDVIYTLKNCRVSAFEAQQAGFLAKAKDAWSCPDGVTRYMDVKYRDKTAVNKLRTEGK